MIERLLRLPEVLDHTGLSRRTIYRKMAEDAFPASVKLGVNAVAWRESEIVAWMAAPMEWRSLEHRDARS
ncbi:MAG: AlpA family transcriptional regulator [Sphingomonadales bacterium]|nr:AlpA family transcriptional regulator [Sphingomonadales bacterium]MBU3992569.1 AlpA family transcriptional regulator [Alphaproteobacteria bacterium]